MNAKIIVGDPEDKRNEKSLNSTHLSHFAIIFLWVFCFMCVIPLRLIVWHGTENINYVNGLRLRRRQQTFFRKPKVEEKKEI